ncbi:MAG: phosphotransferase family protein [Candidatus Thorarchaeota archaeon]
MEAFEENRSQDISLARVIDSLDLFFPDITQNQIEFIYHGTYNVFEVKNKYIFRFPDRLFRNPKGFELIKNEVKMVNFIREKVSVIIPEPIYISSELNNPFMGYKKINGISLSKCFNEISNNSKFRIAETLGNFLSQLHSRDLVQQAINNKIIDIDFNSDKYRQDWQTYYKEICKFSFQLLNYNQKKWVQDLFMEFLGDNKNFDFTPTIVHGDFDTSNVLVDPTTFEVTGIIDFEESRIYDPAADFIFFREGNLFLKKLLTAYQGIKDQNFEERMKFLYGCTCLHYIKFGIEHNYTDMIQAGLQMLKNIMSNFDSIKNKNYL